MPGTMPTTVAANEQPRQANGDGKRQDRESILLKFRHGLGDAIQLTAVLEHLRHYHPNWEVDVASLPGKHSAYHGLCRKLFLLDGAIATANDYDRVFDLSWDECATCYPDSLGAIMISLSSVISRIASRGPSRPSPLALTPPYGR